MEENPHDDPAAWQREKAKDPRPNAQLLEVARRHWDDDDAEEALNALWVLAARASRAELDLALKLADAPAFRDREMGAFVLGRIGNSHEPAYYDETVARLLELTHDESTTVVVAAIYALGQRTADNAIKRLEELSWSEDADVRESVAHSLGMMTESAATVPLVRLSADPEISVRDWATFGLGTLHEDVDTPAIRTALVARTDDHDAEVRGEALIGLARRHDPRAVELIRAELLREAILGDWPFEAASILGDRRLLPDLERVWERFAEEENPRLSAALAEAMDTLKHGR